ncbi:MAG: response regulator transcription factor [Caldilineaceae bacterium]
MEQANVLIVDDHPIVRQGVRSLLSAYPDICIVGEADSPQCAIAQIQSAKPDVVLLDIRLGQHNGISVARYLKETHPESRVIVLTTYDDDESIFSALEAGAYAYLLKDVALDELPEVIRTVCKGQRCLSPKLLDRVLVEFQQNLSTKQVQGIQLSAADQEILSLMAEGLTNREIGDHLHFSEVTVKKKVQAILEELGVANRTQAVALAIRQNII